MDIVRLYRAVVLLTLVLAVLPMAPRGVSAQSSAQTPILLAATVELQRTGLLDALLPLFEGQSGREVSLIAVSSPQVLTLGMRGDVDLLLADATDEETRFMSAGHGVARTLVLHTDAVVVGPRDDPARLREAGSVPDALGRIVATQSAWVSRADNSGMYRLEQSLWQEAGTNPAGMPWFVAVGQGMTQTLTAANERQAYTLVDRATFVSRTRTVDLAVAAQGFPELLTLTDAIVVNPNKSTRIDEAGARALAAFLVGPESQDVIRQFGVAANGTAIFSADAGLTDDQLRPATR